MQLTTNEEGLRTPVKLGVDEKSVFARTLLVMTKSQIDLRRISSTSVTLMFACKIMRDRRHSFYSEEQVPHILGLGLQLHADLRLFLEARLDDEILQSPLQLAPNLVFANESCTEASKDEKRGLTWPLRRSVTSQLTRRT